MANKYIEWSDTDQTNKEVEGLVTSSGASDSGKIPALNAKGEIDKTMLPNVEIKNLPSGENLTAGDYVYVDSSGDVRKASGAAAGNAARGYVEDNVTAPANVDVYFDGTNASLSGLTVGDQYFLDDTTPGGITNTAPVGANKIIQSVGWAISATEIPTQFGQPIKRA
jgi:hypothetical protein